jgi:hypothetical protein
MRGMFLNLSIQIYDIFLRFHSRKFRQNLGDYGQDHTKSLGCINKDMEEVRAKFVIDD